MLERLRLRDFRCFETLDLSLNEGWNFFVGPNAQGKTSILEGICVALRLQSPRNRQLAPLIRHGCRGFVVDAEAEQRRFQFYYSSTRKKLALDGVEMRGASEYLSHAKLVYFSNDDVLLIRGAAEERRRFLDFLGAQVHPEYRDLLRRYTTALRSRNAALKQGRWSAAALRGFEEEWVSSGERLRQLRAGLLDDLRVGAEKSYLGIAGDAEMIETRPVWVPEGSLAQALHAARDEDHRLRQTTVGPHRDDWEVLINGKSARLFASEGQQRTAVLSLRMAQIFMLERLKNRMPILLLDDVFGELDSDRRNSLLAALPEGCQKLVTSTRMDWLKEAPGETRFYELQRGQVALRQ